MFVLSTYVFSLPSFQIIRDAVNISPIIVDSTQAVYHPVVNVAHISQNPSASAGMPYVIRSNVSNQCQLSDVSVTLLRLFDFKLRLSIFLCVCMEHSHSHSQQSESPSQPSSPIESRSSSPRVKLQSSRHKHDSRSSSLEAAPSHQSISTTFHHEMYIPVELANKGDIKMNKEVGSPLIK